MLLWLSLASALGVLIYVFCTRSRPAPAPVTKSPWELQLDRQLTRLVHSVRNRGAA